MVDLSFSFSIVSFKAVRIIRDSRFLRAEYLRCSLPDSPR